MTTILTYATLTLDSSEITDLSIETGLKVEENDTFNPKTVTQPGSIQPTKIDIKAEIRKNSTTKFDSWYNLTVTRPLENLVVFTRAYGLCYLTSLKMSTTELDKTGDVLFFSMDLSFIQNVNF